MLYITVMLATLLFLGMIQGDANIRELLILLHGLVLLLSVIDHVRKYKAVCGICYNNHLLQLHQYC